MAYKVVKSDPKWFGVVEFNNFSAQRNGRNKAQLPMKPEDFIGTDTPCEQGMLLVYDEAAGFVRKAKNHTEEVMLHKSEEKLYDSRLQELKHFALFGDENIAATVITYDSEGKPTTEAVNFLDYKNPPPRLYHLDIGDTWTTDTVVYDDAEFADFEAIKTAFVTPTVLWGYVQTGLTDADEKYNGYIRLSATLPVGVKRPLKLIKVYTMPDGISDGLKFEVYPQQA